MSPTLAARAITSVGRCALLFFATTINYVDRQVLSLLAKTLEVHIGWTADQYGNITSAFATAYAIGLLGAGRLLDKFGTRIAFAIAVTVWSAAAMMHAAATSALTFGIARVFLGFGEAANFPACIKTVAEWFPKRQRGVATGIFNSGANLGAVATILLVPWMAEKYGWHPPSWRPERSASSGSECGCGSTGSRNCIESFKEELALIRSDPADRVASVPWRRVFPKKETWAFAMGKFCTDPIWWFFLFCAEIFAGHVSSFPDGYPVPTLIVTTRPRWAAWRAGGSRAA